MPSSTVLKWDSWYCIYVHLREYSYRDALMYSPQNDNSAWLSKDDAVCRSNADWLKSGAGQEREHSLQRGDRSMKKEQNNTKDQNSSVKKPRHWLQLFCFECLVSL